MIKITECPRDAMQGLKSFIPTDRKINWLNALLKVGYDVLDFGSFVSSRVIPQLKDTSLIVEKLDLDSTDTKLLAITANHRGAQEACRFEQISFLGYPHSTSETFLKRNINSNIKSSRLELEKIQNIAKKNNKEVLVYIGMCFGNIYGETWYEETILEEVSRLKEIGISNIAMSDTSGVGTKEVISSVMTSLFKNFPKINFNLHLHTTPINWHEKVDAAYKSGCRHFDVVINGMGGCPLAASKMTGNLNTSLLLEYIAKNKIENKINKENFNKAAFLTFDIFRNIHQVM
ncbi:MAG: hypothetical protein ACEPOW_12435 [Bacteroidales bacterium]